MSKVKSFFSRVGNTIYVPVGWAGNLFKRKSSKVQKGLIILGMQNAGKTTIYDFLRGKKNAGVSTNIDDYDEFTFKMGGGEEIHIREGKDLGGDDGIFGKYHDKMINDEHVDFCFFVFNVFEYLNTLDYRRRVNSRLHSMYHKNILLKNTAIVGSYYDALPDNVKQVVYEELYKFVDGKSYKDLLSREFLYLLDLRSKKEIKIMLTKTLLK